MRRSASATLILVTLAVAGACGQPQAPAPEADAGFLFLRSSRGVSVIEPGADEPSFRGGRSIPSRDWSTVVRAQVGKEGTRVTSLNPKTGVEHWSQTIPNEKLSVKVVSDDGNMAVLTSQQQAHYAYGRTETEFTIVRNGRDVQKITLPGNYEPEAFSTDGENLFVINYLPAKKPSKYQVRRLDLVIEEVMGVYTPHEELQRAMGGTARIQAGSPDGSRLYTLYTLGNGANSAAFIHVLDLDRLWAHCIDLPKEFARGADFASALTVSADNESLYVGNARADVLAEVDTESLEVERTATIDFGRGWDVHATSGSNERLFFGVGRTLTAINLSEFAKETSWELEGMIRGLQESTDATRLYVGSGKQVDVIDVASGQTLETIDPPGVGRIYQLGPAGPPLDNGFAEDFTCAC